MAILLVTVIAPPIRWRAQVVMLYLTGQIPDIDLKRLLAYVMPGSGQWLRPLVEARSPYAVIRNVRTSPADIAEGGTLFRSQCAECHAPDGSGGRGPSLIGRAFTHGESDWALYRTIRFGIPHTAMPPHPLPDAAIWQLAAFVRSLDSAHAALATPGNTPRASPPVDVPYEELAVTREPAADWLTYSGSYWSSRHSALSQINRGNVGRLALRWIQQLEDVPECIEASPLVRHGIMFVTQPPSRVRALDATTGKQLWVYEHELSSALPAGDAGNFSVTANRGVAMLSDKVFFGTPDARLIAVSAATGALQWETTVATDLSRYAITGAPLAYRDLVVTGIAIRGSDAGGRGFIAAYDAATGKERWRFATIPESGQPGNETWADDSWRGGGAPTWLTGSYDPELDLLIWPVGNPKPDYDAPARKGDNLYSNSAVALRGATGSLVWYFQFTPGDDHDWDAAEIPVLADRRTPAGTEKRVLWANRNGFFYVLDRTSGKYVTAAPFVQQTWTEGLDPQGRPKPPATPSRNREGFLLYPGYVGATSWWSPSFDPALNLMFIPILEQGMVYFTKTPPAALGGRPFYTAVRALDAATGKRVWEYRQEPRRDTDRSGGVRMGGLLSTAGGVVFGGDRTTFFALDSNTGTRLWSVETGGTICAAPVTFKADQAQFVVIAAGRNLLGFALPNAH
ncbi:MAG TPA: PQQ-binding-like beta-propeller repeat protein [Gemmatimonadales bacterium]|nr:PQQ-binding-like beta-propeller repeat protein [Gemmatimonadales bacterium]